MQSIKYFDAHTHVHFAAYDDDRKEVIERALAAGVAMISVGTQKDTSQSAVAIAHQFDHGMYAAVGLHPIHTQKSYHDTQELGGGEAAKAFTSRGEVFDYHFYLTLAEDKKVVAIGECGLDYYRLEENTKKKQLEVFESHIKLSHASGKPLMIHCRQAFDDLIPALRQHKEMLAERPGVVHFFTGTKDHAHMLLGLGFSFTFGGVVTFTHDYDEVIRSIPIDRILSETDAPYVAPIPYRGRRNEPVYVTEVVKKLAEIKGVEEQEMAQQIVKNAKQVFNIS